MHMERRGRRGVIEAALRRCLESAGLREGESLLVAYSAGPDSTALLAQAAAIGLPSIAAAYVDHGIRPETERESELALARRNCARLGLPLSVARIRPGAVEGLAAAQGIGVEAAARRYRYHALRSIGKRRGSRVVLMAHNLDDQVETALARFLGGSGSGGLRGMPAVNGLFLRPFLAVPKADLVAYVEGLGLEYSTDSTNLSSRYSRNRMRLEVAPALDAAFPGWRSGVLLAASKAALEEEALAAAAARLAFSEDEGSPPSLRTAASAAASTRGIRSRSMSADGEPLLSAPRAVAVRAFVDATGRLLGQERVSARLAMTALDSLARGEPYRGGGLDARIDAGRVRIARTLDFPRRDGYFVRIDGPCRIRAGRILVEAAWAEGDIRGLAARGIRAEAFSFPLALRSRRPGDEIDMPCGTKRLDDFLAEMGLPQEIRGRIPIVEDRNGIVAVLGARFGFDDRYRRGPIRDAESERETVRCFVIDVKGA
jgi:tRNA(Ile)-lysidine synthetase-like protein